MPKSHSTQTWQNNTLCCQLVLQQAHNQRALILSALCTVGFERLDILQIKHICCSMYWIHGVRDVNITQFCDASCACVLPGRPSERHCDALATVCTHQLPLTFRVCSYSPIYRDGVNTAPHNQLPVLLTLTLLQNYNNYYNSAPTSRQRTTLAHS